MSIDWSHNGAYLIVGDNIGTIHSLDASTLKLVHSLPSKQKAKESKEITDLKISKNNVVAYGVGTKIETL